MLLLASASARRRELLDRLGVDFQVVPSNVDETPSPGLSPDAAAREIARRKALVGAAVTDGPVLAADTMVVAADGEILGKPRDVADACRMLRKLSGTTHRVVTGVCLATDRGRHLDETSASTAVTMRALSDEEISAYVATGESFDKAGAYALQDTADRFVTKLEGSPTNVIGLPMEIVADMLRAAGVATRPWA